MKNIKEFEVYVPQSKIDLLHEKIALTRWPDELNDNKWSLGTSLDYLKKATHAWVNDFSWRDHEALINNAGSHMFHSSSGLDIHFLHSKSKHKNAYPLVMTHGWPGSVQEFLSIIPILNEGIDGVSFDVVCPSMPGYGFSSKPNDFGMNSQEIAKINHELMLALGYKKYIAQGGDWGATVSKWMADQFKDSCKALHLNLVLAWPPDSDDPMQGVTEEEIEGMKNFEKYQEKGFGYFAIQSTKPQTVAYGLNDSPIGLAAWIIEKFHAWTDDNSDQLVIPLDHVLSIVSLYWYTETISSSMRLYYENGQTGFSFDYVDQPTGCAVFDHEIAKPPKAWAEKIYNIKHWDTHPGGHFAAMENAKILAESIVNLVKKGDLSAGK